MHRPKIIHELVDELCNRDLGQITMGLIPDQAHCENITQRSGNKVRIFADEELKACCEIFVGCHLGVS
jgi:hypothetical protein